VIQIKRDKAKLPTINSKVTSICNKQQQQVDVKPQMQYHAFREKKENIFDILLSFLKLAQGANDTQASGKQNKNL
jgi:hypothetical protein